MAWLDELEERLGKPVLTANQVSIWQGLRLAGDRTARKGLGRLFTEPPAESFTEPPAELPPAEAPLPGDPA
jgi:hypothetical protein